MATSKARKNAFYAQSGGVTAVINASACGVIETARAHRDVIANVYAGRNGIIGALTEELIDTGKESAAAIRALRTTPAGAFGSCRYKLKSLDKNRREYERLIEVFRAHDIAWFFYNGGGDSADTCFKMSQLSQSMGYPLQAIHVPKTVDNDLPITDCCPGFGSVAKYVAVSALEASLDVRSMARTSTKVFVLEVMGRHAGWIAVHSGIAGGADVILIPERPFDIENVCTHLKRRHERGRYFSIVVAAEGATPLEGTLATLGGETDEFGHGQVLEREVEARTGFETRATVLGHVQRGGTPTAFDRVLATRCGTAAIDAATEGRWGTMTALRGAKIELVPLAAAVASLKTVPPEDFAVAEAFFG
jgi:6-phosphofructokinase 1